MQAGEAAHQQITLHAGYCQLVAATSETCMQQLVKSGSCCHLLLGLPAPHIIVQAVQEAACALAAPRLCHQLLRLG